MLDEPFGALDAFTREELWCMMRDIHQSRGVTAMLVTMTCAEAVFPRRHRVRDERPAGQDCEGADD